MSAPRDRASREALASDAARRVAPREPVTVGIQPRELDDDVAAVEARYEAAHQAWLDALRVCRSGKPADLARLAIAQRTYEELSVELERAHREAAERQVRLEALRARRLETARRAETIANQAAAWMRIHQEPRQSRGLRGVIARLLHRV